MRDELARVIALQGEYTSSNTPAMKERGQIVRQVLPAKIRPLIKPQFPWSTTEGRDATGQKSRVPWVRVCDKERSPSARYGWYVVYLFHEDGGGVTLSLNQGTTEFIRGAFKSLPADWLARRVEWAREKLGMSPLERPGNTKISVGDGDLARAYNRGNVVGYTYTGTLPDDDQLQADLSAMLVLLSRLYELAAVSPPPGAPDPAIVALSAEIDSLAGRRPRAGAPRRLLADERAVIEQHAMFLAKDLLVKEGWLVKDTHLKEPYDFLARRGGRKLYVEVKGTTTKGEAVILTKNEVRHHKAHPEESCLIVVRDIVMLQDVDEPTCTGGIREMWMPWAIGDEHLTPMAYEYRVRPPGPSLSRVGPDGVRTTVAKKSS